MLMLFIDRLVNITNNMSDFVNNTENNDGNNDVMDKLLKKYGSFMFLKVCVDDSCMDIKTEYRDHIFKHNAKVFCEEEIIIKMESSIVYQNL